MQRPGRHVSRCKCWSSISWVIVFYLIILFYPALSYPVPFYSMIPHCIWCSILLYSDLSKFTQHEAIDQVADSACHRTRPMAHRRREIAIGMALFPLGSEISLLQWKAWVPEDMPYHIKSLAARNQLAGVDTSGFGCLSSLAIVKAWIALTAETWEAQRDRVPQAYCSKLHSYFAKRSLRGCFLN